MKCPVCDSEDSISLSTLKCKNFDGSVIYKDIKITACKNCGHVYNDLTDEEVYNLERYYSEEYAPLNLNPVATCALRPGSNSFFSLKRYAELYKLIEMYVNKDTRILDVGCALGGLLSFLKEKGHKELYGIDVIEEYVELSKNKSIKVGSVYDIPFEDNFFDVIILDHVLEHLVDLKSVIKELKRVLSREGILLIGLPDASRYDNMIFWFTIREHVQHFDLEHLDLLFDSNGFELLDYSKTNMPIDDKNKIPNLMVLFDRRPKKSSIDIGRLNTQLRVKDKINSLVETLRPIYCYGIGREFLFFYMNTNLRIYDKLTLVDDITLKQEEYTIEGREIVDSSVLKYAPKDSILIITPSLYMDVMRNKAIDIGYIGEIIYA